MNCKHRFQHWIINSDGIYELHCFICNKQLEGLSFHPSTTEPFDSAPPDLGITVTENIEMKDIPV